MYLFVCWGKSKCEAALGWLVGGVASLLLLRRMANTACPNVFVYSFFALSFNVSTVVIA
jgi:hypothetical protein